jgi:hypothetical protein
MNVYAVIATVQESVAPVRQAVEAQFVGNFVAVSETCWLVADPLDVMSVSKKLGIAEETPPTAGLTGVMVIWVIGYWGNASINIWAWMNQKMLQQASPPLPQPVAQQSAE